MSETAGGRFPKSAHLLRHSDFVRVYRQGRRHFSGNMTLFYLPNKDVSQAAEAGVAAGGAQRHSVRVGFTVPKALGGAVDRNRMRRRAREAVRRHLALLQNMDAAVDVVINPKKSLLTADFAQISHEVERALAVIRRAGAQANPVASAPDRRSANQAPREGEGRPQDGAARPGRRTAASRREGPQR